MNVKRASKDKYIKVLILLILIIGVVLGGIYISDKEKMTENKVLVIGIDAMDPKVTNKLMQENKLPNFKRLNELGSYSKLQTTIPPETPVAWSAAATGSNPGKYGVFDFINRDPETYLPKLNLAREKKGLIKTKYESALMGTPFWEITSKKGIPTTLIRWPVTFPPDKIKGNMLSGLGVVDIKGLLNSYRFYTSEQYDKESEGAEKVIGVKKEDGIIKTKIYGPYAKKDKDIVEVEKDMTISLLDNRATLIIDEKEYSVDVNGWSDWIRIKFDLGFGKEVYGIFKVYLISTNPYFNMYITTIQIDPENQVVDITYPKDYGKELVKEIGLFYTLGLTEDTKAVTEKRITTDVFLEQVNEIENDRNKMFWYEFNRFERGILAFGFDASDRLKHIFWKDKVLVDDGFEVSEEIEDYFIEKDKLLGHILDKIDDNTKLIIFSDHGFSSFERAVSVNTWLVKNGFMTLNKQPTDKDHGELFKNVDWSKTKAYSLGFTSIYINEKGREKNGIVENKEEVINEIVEGLSKLKDPKYNKNVITMLYKGRDTYIGKFAEEGPDIVIGFEPGYRMSWQNAVGGLTKEILMDNNEEWKGDHLIDRSHVPGVIFTNFKIKKENPSLIDIAPTILSIFNIKIPNEMDGETLI